MKKTYKNPSMMVVNINPVHILAGSIKEVSGPAGFTKGNDVGGGDVVTTEARGSRFSTWSEDED